MWDETAALAQSAVVPLVAILVVFLIIGFAWAFVSVVTGKSRDQE